MSTMKLKLGRWAAVLALVPIAASVFAGQANAYDRHRGHYDRGHYDRGPRWHDRGYYAPPPPVYYPAPRPSPGISLFFPIR